MKVFKVRYEKLGGHYHCRIFSGGGLNQTYARIGDITMDEDDWKDRYRLFSLLVGKFEEVDAG